MPKSKDKRVTTKMKFCEASIVDLGAQAGAEIVFMKRRSDEHHDDENAVVSKRAALTSVTDGHAHSISLDGYNSISLLGTTSYDNGHSHSWILLEDGTVEVAEANGHKHDVVKFSAAAYVAKMKPADDEDEDTFVSRFMSDEKAASEYPDKKQRAAVAHKTFTDKTKSKASKSNPAGHRADADEGEAAMADESKLAETQKALDAANARARRLEALVDMPSDQQAFAKSLPASERDAFIDAPATDRAARVSKAAADDAVVYTSADGQVFRKSHDPAVVALVRSNDSLVAKAAAAEERELVATYKARVPAEIGNLPGPVDAGAALLRAVDGIKDEANRTAVKAMLKAGNDALKATFQRLGTSVTAPEDGSAAAAFEAMVAKAKAADPKLTDARARIAAAQTPEGRAAYKRMHQESREVAGAR